jgi:integrase
MPLEFRRGRDGTLRPHWYGAFMVDGKRYGVNLGIAITGKIPASGSLKDQGDAAFERSRHLAMAKLEEVQSEASRKSTHTHLLERIIEIKSGEAVATVRLDDLGAEWVKIPRRRQTNLRYAAQCQSTLARFVAFLKATYPKAREIIQVTRPMARAFLEVETQRGVTAKTWNDTLKLLRATFKHLLPGGANNPFLGIPTREQETVFRKPFTPEELNAILQAAEADDFIRPVIVIGLCTAMRRGDCCTLKWADVDLNQGFITVKTAKTGQTVSIPIFPKLRDELAALPRAGSPFVLPAQARMYAENPDGITWRVRKVFAAAGFADAADRPQAESGESLPAAEPTPIHRGDIHAERATGLRRASLRDFHSFRVTWVTLALTAGVPLEIVQKVTGHKTADVVLKHYYQPGRDDFRATLQNAMPKLLMKGERTATESILAILDAMTPQSLEHDREQIRRLLAGPAYRTG